MNCSAPHFGHRPVSRTVTNAVCEAKELLQETQDIESRFARLAIQTRNRITGGDAAEGSEAPRRHSPRSPPISSRQNFRTADVHGSIAYIRPVNASAAPSPAMSALRWNARKSLSNASRDRNCNSTPICQRVEWANVPVTQTQFRVTRPSAILENQNWSVKLSKLKCGRKCGACLVFEYGSQT